MLQKGELLLVVEEMSLAMHLVFQGEVESDMFHSFIREGLCVGLIFLLLDVLDHVWEPHCQAVVAARVMESGQLEISLKMN